MAQSTALRREESLGLALAIAGHAALFAWLIWQKPAAPPPPPERMTVTISDEVGLTSAAPAPQAEAAPDKGPEIGDVPPPPVPEPVQVAKPAPTPPRPAPAPARVPPKPAAQPAKPPLQAKAPQPAQQKVPAKPPAKPGSSSFDDAFSKGIPGARTQGKAQTPAAPITGAVRSSLAGAISRELKPKWRGRAPTGIDAEKLVTILTWDLNPDGTLAGTPRVVRQEGITASNKAQAGRHAEEAIRAVRLAAPFDLPPQFYSAWKRVSEFRFDRSLGQ